MKAGRGAARSGARERQLDARKLRLDQLDQSFKLLDLESTCRRIVLAIEELSTSQVQLLAEVPLRSSDAMSVGLRRVRVCVSQMDTPDVSRDLYVGLDENSARGHVDASGDAYVYIKKFGRFENNLQANSSEQGP